MSPDFLALPETLSVVECSTRCEPAPHARDLNVVFATGRPAK